MSRVRENKDCTLNYDRGAVHMDPWWSSHTHRCTMVTCERAQTPATSGAIVRVNASPVKNRKYGKVHSLPREFLLQQGPIPSFRRLPACFYCHVLTAAGSGEIRKRVCAYTSCTLLPILKLPFPLGMYG